MQPYSPELASDRDLQPLNRWQDIKAHPPEEGVSSSESSFIQDDLGNKMRVNLEQ